MSLCLNGVDRAPSTPTTRAIATKSVTRRFTGTAYGPTREKVGVDQIVHKALQNCCFVIGHSRIRLSGNGQPARAATAFAGTCRGPCSGWSLPCTGRGAPERAWAGRTRASAWVSRALTILRIQTRPGSSTKWYSSTAPRSATAKTPTIVNFAPQLGVRTIPNCAVVQFHAVCTNSCTMYRLNDTYPPYTITRVDSIRGRLPTPAANVTTSGTNNTSTSPLESEIFGRGCASRT